MARYNEILVGRFARGVQKLFGIKGEVPTASLAGEIGVTHALQSGRENRYLEDWQMYAGRESLGGVAAQDSVVRASNPSNSNIVAVIESMFLFVSSPVNGDIFLEFAATGNNGSLGGSPTPAAFDSRKNPPGTGNNGAALVLSGTNNIGQGNHIVFAEVILPNVNTLTNEFINYEQQEIVILPGADLQFRSVTLNISFTVMLRWRERFLEESERT